MIWINKSQAYLLLIGKLGLKITRNVASARRLVGRHSRGDGVFYRPRKEEVGLDKELVNRFKQVQNMPSDEKKTVLSLMDAFIAKMKIQSFLQPQV
jgi:hypothetical protein